jgi:hypothetical protein
MGGAVKSVTNALGITKKSPAVEATPAPKRAQVTETAKFQDEMSGSEKVNRKRQGKKRLQIPASAASGAGAAASTGGTGLGTGA